jgi:hypothetical protein
VIFTGVLRFMLAHKLYAAGGKRYGTPSLSVIIAHPRGAT